jgi:hypothetical protein
MITLKTIDNQKVIPRILRTYAGKTKSSPPLETRPIPEQWLRKKQKSDLKN